MVSTNPRPMPKGADRRQQHGGDPPRQRGRRQRLPRLHLRGGVRDHPRGGGQPDPVGASAVSHDLYATVFKKAPTRPRAQGLAHHHHGAGRDRCAAGDRPFEKQNIAFMVSLAFAIAASANFRCCSCRLLWKDCMTRGATTASSRPDRCGSADHRCRRRWEVTPATRKGSALFPTLRRPECRWPRASSASGCSRSSTTARAKEDRAGYMAQKVRSGDRYRRGVGLAH